MKFHIKIFNKILFCCALYCAGIASAFASSGSGLIPIMVGDITIFVSVASSTVYQDSAGNLYVKVSSNKYLKLSQATSGDWTITEVTQSQWNALTTVSQYSIAYGNFGGDTLEDFKLISGSEKIVFLQTPSGTFQERRVIFIHTDLLGSPVAETNSKGMVQ